MNIVFLCPSINPSKGGVERVTNVLGDYFSRHKCNVYYLALWQQHNREEKGLIFLPDHTADNAIANKTFLYQFCIDNEIDIVIAQIGAPGNGSDLATSVPQNVKKIACIHMNIFDAVRHFGAVHNYYFKKFHLEFLSPFFEDNILTDILIKIKKIKYKNAYKRLCKEFDRVVLLSDAFKPDFFSIVGKKYLDKVISVPNPLPSSQSVSSIDDKEKLVLFVGRINCAEKRVDYLLHIWNLVCRKVPDWKLKIVGEGVDVPLLKKKALELKLLNYSFEGFQDPTPYYSKASLFCLTSANESFGMVLIESMKEGVVPIAFDSYASAKDIIDDGINGKLIKPFDISAFADAIIMLIQNKEQRKEMANKALEKSKQFSIDSVGPQWLQILKTKKMNIKKEIDLLVIARPDHSHNIYKALGKTHMKFTYMVFKFLPKWLNRLIAKNKLREIGDNCSICWSMTLINTLHYNLGWNWLSKISESHFYQPHIRRFLRTHAPRLIHYWPEYCTDLIREYKQECPGVKTLAEIVFMNEQFVLDENAEYLTSLGLADNLEYIKKNNEITKRVMEFETDFMVPSKLVADSFKKYYPNKHYHIVSYGIPILPNYKKKKHIRYSTEVVDFVYAGKISIEKGCDLLCQYFSCHPEKHIYLYGNIHNNEKHIFEQFKQYKNIVFYGSVPKVKLQSLLIQYDAGIHLSRFDSFSLAVAEIIGCGVPVIVSNRTGICSDVEKINAGVVTRLDKLSIEKSIDYFCSPCNYNNYIDSIDNYIGTPHTTYGENIVRLYKTIIE